MITLSTADQARIAEASRLSALPYNGVSGAPPDWFPFHVRGEFLRIRFRLLLEYSAQHILLMIQYLDGTLVLPEKLESEGYHVHIPTRLRPDIWRLFDYKRAFDLGPVEGLDLLLGKNIAGDARRGAIRLVQLREFGQRRGKNRKDAAAKKHGEWIKEARRLWLLNRRLSIREVARRAKEKLTIASSEHTIREVIAEYKPKKT